MGYHRISADMECIIPAGAMYSVVVTQIKEEKPYITVTYGVNKQGKEELAAMGIETNRKSCNAVVNRGESFVLYQDNWIDLIDMPPEFIQNYLNYNRSYKEEWIVVDNISIKVYADFVDPDPDEENDNEPDPVPEETDDIAEETGDASVFLLIYLAVTAMLLMLASKNRRKQAR